MGSAGGVGTDFAKALVAFVDEVLDFEAFEFAEGLGEVGLEAVGGFLGVAVGSAEGFFDDVIDGAEFDVVACGELEGFSGGGVGFGVGLFPEDGGAAFGRDDGEPSELHHGESVGDAYAEGSA